MKSVVKDAIKGFEKVDSMKNKMLKQVQHDIGKRVRDGRQVVCVRITKDFENVNSSAGDPGSRPG